MIAGRPRRRETVKRYHYDSHEQLRARLADFVSAHDLGRPLETLRALTPYEAICKAWSAEPSRFRSNPLHQIPGPNSLITLNQIIPNPADQFG